MKIEKDYFYVTGYYYLKTDGGHSVPLVYPFPADSIYGEADSVHIFNLTANQAVEPLAQRRDAIIFKAEFGEYTELVILISYRQRLLDNRAEYILESTASWRKPLEQADYQLIVPAGMEMVSFSIPPDESITTGEEKIYYWARTNYMPSVNMIFEFINE